VEPKNELFTALSKAQLEFYTAEKTSANPFFKSRYADFAEIVAASRPALCKHGLCVTQSIDDQFLVTILGHSSGQFIESRMKIAPVKQDIQSLGSYITYAKRYAYAAIVGVVVGEQDDDGEAAVRVPIKKPIEESGDDFISNDQYQILKQELEGRSDMEKRLLERYSLSGIEEIRRSNFSQILAQVRHVKQMEKDAQKV
jgi:hypothetical protein